MLTRLGGGMVLPSMVVHGCNVEYTMADTARAEVMWRIHSGLRQRAPMLESDETTPGCQNGGWKTSRAI